MVQFQKTPQGDTWRLRNANGDVIGRVWGTSHADRIIRDGSLAEAIAPALALTGAARRQAVRDAFATWSAAGGHSVDFSNISVSLQNPPGSGNFDGKAHLYLDGIQVGYLDISDPPDGTVARLVRMMRLSEEAFSAEQLGSNALRNQALDAAVNRFRDDGALA